MNLKDDRQKFYSWQKNALLIELQIQTKASRDSVIGEHNNRLKVAITASPTKGKANEHLIKFLATYFGVPKSNVKIIKGLQSKLKLALIVNPKQNLTKFKVPSTKTCCILDNNRIKYRC